jgi:VWFA-related protein
MRSRSVCVALASAIALGVTLSGQTFKAGVELVRVDVSVTRGGQPVRGLTAADFSIVDAGMPQRVNSVMLVEELPLDVQMVLDTSGSVAGEELHHLIDAGRGLLAALKPEDQVGLITFGQRIQVNVPASRDHTRVAGVLPTLTGQGPTAVRDAIWLALQLHSPGEARPLVLAFSDGIDTASWLTSSALLEGVRRTGIVVHSVELKAPGQTQMNYTYARQRPPTLLEWVAEAAGGRAWSATSSRDLRELFTRAIDEMRARYLVTFYPDGPRRPGWHELKIGVKGRGDVKARPGYYLAAPE